MLAGAGKIEIPIAGGIYFMLFKKKLGNLSVKFIFKKIKYDDSTKDWTGNLLRDNRNTTESCAVVIPYEQSYLKHKKLLHAKHYSALI